MERACNRCIHYNGDECTRWTCEMETKEQFAQKIKEETVSKMAEMLRNSHKTIEEISSEILGGATNE